MAFPAVVVHLEVEFDSACIEPQPWWRPFCWWCVYEDNGHWQRVLRLGVLGLHLCLCASYYPPMDHTTARDPKEDP